MAGAGPGLLGPGARPPPSRLWSCRLLRAGAHAAGGPRPCGLTAPGEQAEAHWEEGGTCTGLLSAPRLLLPWGQAGNHPAERPRTKQLATPSSPLAPLPQGKAAPSPASRVDPGTPSSRCSPRPSAAHLWESRPAAHWGTCGAAGLAAARRSGPPAPPRASGTARGGSERPACSLPPSKVNSHHHLPSSPSPGLAGTRLRGDLI